jgi:hypothetical protein
VLATQGRLTRKGEGLNGDGQGESSRTRARCCERLQLMGAGQDLDMWETGSNGGRGNEQIGQGHPSFARELRSQGPLGSTLDVGRGNQPLVRVT